MTRELDLVFEDILESISKIREYTQAISLDEFRASSQVRDAVERRLEIIGEAAKKIPKNIRVRHPDVPWKKVTGMRDVLVHAYFSIRVERIWNTARQDLDALENAVRTETEKI